MRIEDHLHRPWLQIIALPLWLLFRRVVAIRNFLYEKRLIQIRRLPVPVISVGNIAVGGTGKTPVVQWLVDYLCEIEKKPAVLARGYKAGPEGANDEAAMLQAPVFCDSNRYRAGQTALAAGHDVMILDDGFQHRRLHRDCDIVCLDTSRPTGHPQARRARTLPLGLFRESYQALRRADIAVQTRCDQAAPAGRATVTAAVAQAKLRTVACAHQAQAAYAINNETERCPIADLPGKLLAVAAIAVPEAFRKTLMTSGATVSRLLPFPDHHRYTGQNIKDIIAAAAGDTVVCTAKDAVKLQPLWPATVPLWVVPIKLVWEDDDEDRLRQLLQSYLA